MTRIQIAGLVGLGVALVPAAAALVLVAWAGVASW